MIIRIECIILLEEIINVSYSQKQKKALVVHTMTTANTSMYKSKHLFSEKKTLYWSHNFFSFVLEVIM